MPKISIIVPVYKVEAYLRRCVDSVLAQTFQDFELILVDDGSPDSCGAICDDYAAKDGRVHVIHQKNGGLSAARNAGIDWTFASSDSQWLTFIDSDDWVHPSYLETLLQAAQETGVELSICGFVRTSGSAEDDIPEQEYQVTLWEPEDFWCANNVNAAIAVGKLYRKPLFQTVRYPVGRIHEDEFTTYRILFSLSRIAAVPAPMYRYLQNDEGIMRQAWRPARMDALDALEAQLNFFRKQGLSQALQYGQKRYLYTWNLYYRTVSEPGAEFASYRPILRKRLRRFLRKQRRDLPFKSYERYYELAWPKTVRIYRALRSRGGKIIRKLRK